MRPFLSVAILLIAAGSASACLNDATLVGSEREFRSQYQTAPILVEPPPAYDQSGFTMRIGIGAVLGVAAIALAIRRSPAA